MRAKLAALAAIAGIITACGTTHAGPPTAVTVAHQVGATKVYTISPTMYADSEANATWHGRHVDIVTFTSAQKENNWIQAAEQYVTILSKGNLWVIAS
jgi:uncharacterized RmlC-like cupin family protein